MAIQEVSFSRLVVVMQVLLALVGMAVGGYVYVTLQMADIQRIKVHVVTVVSDEHRRSEELARLARYYVRTVDAQVRQHYEAVAMLYDGLSPAWQQLATQGDFTLSERDQLTVMHMHLQQLRAIELQAVRLARVNEPKGPPLNASIALLSGTTYQHVQQDVFQALDAFSTRLQTRLQAALSKLAFRLVWLQWLLMVLFLLLGYMCLHTVRRLKQILGADVDKVHAEATRLYHGTLQEAIVVPSGLGGSVLGRLAEIQKQLGSARTREHAARKNSQRQAQLYLALRQCNQAIVRCQSRQALFEQICRIIVVFGHAKMVWIGELDADNETILAVATYGEGTDYLNRVTISANMDIASGRGPCGLSIATDNPCWVDDFLNDSRTVMWHQHAAQFGWAACASLPLHCAGKVVGCLSLYADQPGAFDSEVQNLLLEMAADIDFALDRFAIESERAQYRESLRLNEEHARQVLENALDAVINIDAYGVITEWSGSALRIFGYTRDEVLGRNLAEVIVPPVHREAHATGMQRLLQSGEPHLIGKLIEITALRRDGAEFPVELTIASIARDGEHYFSAFVRDISRRKASEARITYLANYDALTGLPNRNHLNECVRKEIQRAQQFQTQFALMFLDLDHFKDVNDSLGHSFGDSLLIELAQRFQALLRHDDVICRLGGDEFVFLIHGADHQAAKEMVERLLCVIDEPIQIEQYQLSVSASIGITLYPDDGEDIESLQRNADVAMYRTKKESRNGYRFFSSTMQIQSARNLQLVNALRQAITLEQLAVFYQPQIDLQTQEVIGVEALLRWTHPELGPISPAEFIPLAESSGLIMSIGGWVLEQAVQQIQCWHAEGFENMRVAVNLSSIQFRNPELPVLVAKVLEKHALSPAFLELELTEGVALEDPVGAMTMMDALDQLGVRLSIDDFGTGYSSLSYLKKFKVYKLKIDQSFVRDISTDEEDKAIVIAIIHLARSLGLKTIAEGVETPSQQDFLQSHGCDEMQGYLLSRPLSSVDATVFLRSRYPES
ncbi:bifunctional diguanylate cyclase/phosphodiesterase [Methylophilus aquaticus]|uniref:EAL domain-containing protein n=1 Tax=Methylophilus aquaticus TaxID=1971610 RepID=A0ABT9JTD9_9PROT|nr:EAL domain-containing protein [Methylophilus aquaticus]MDP8567401.1 EAL domain-containing protein [Methylophilus aquaticus]